MAGFSTFRREDIVLLGAFAAQVNTQLAVGALDETATGSRYGVARTSNQLREATMKGIAIRRLARSMVQAGLGLVVVLLALATMAASVPGGKAEDVGLSSERLQRINQLIQRYIDAKEISGAVTVVARKGRVAHFEAQGMMDIESRTPMRKDAIFRIASMTKPVTGVAVLMLVEEGKIRLTDPVSLFIPEFRNTKVAIRKPAPAPAGQAAGEPEIYLVPANREITIRDLMTHRRPGEWRSRIA